MIGVLGCVAPACRGQCPLPSDLAIATPPPSVPAEAARFLGAWGEGQWEGQLPAFLVVESISPGGRAEVVYSTGQSGPVAPRWRRIEARVSDDHLEFVSSKGAQVDFWLDGTDAVFGRFTAGQHPFSARLRRVTSSDLAAIRAAAAAPVSPAWEEIEITEHLRHGKKDYSELKLEVTLYRNPQPGRHPLVVFNHGSTGPGIIPASQVDRAWEASLVFTSLGYSVVVPMRKGRGRSQGALIEESDVPPAIQLAAAMQDVDTVVAFMRKQPYVDPSRIVIAGQSRGGFLAVVYAGRHPEGIEGAISFAGGWFGQRTALESFNRTQFADAGRSGRPPMLWLCARRDSYYSPDYVAGEFSGFRAAGGAGRLLTFDGVPGNGHFLISWPEKWREPVAAFLGSLRPTPAVAANALRSARDRHPDGGGE